METYEDVKMFMEYSDQNQHGINSSQAKLYLKLVEEEFTELTDAFAAKDLVEVADGIIDLIWVLEGLAITCNIPVQEIWDEVARSNMSKINPKTGKTDKNENGKVLKPATYSPPEIRKILKEHKLKV